MKGPFGGILVFLVARWGPIGSLRGSFGVVRALGSVMELLWWQERAFGGVNEPFGSVRSGAI